jgi:hypothetical protein
MSSNPIGKIASLEIGSPESVMCVPSDDPILQLFQCTCNQLVQLEKDIRHIDSQYSQSTGESFFTGRTVNLSDALETLKKYTDYNRYHNGKEVDVSIEDIAKGIGLEVIAGVLGGEAIGGFVCIVIEIAMLAAMAPVGLVLGATFGTWGAIWLIGIISGVHFGSKNHKQRLQNVEGEKQELMTILRNMMSHKKEILNALKMQEESLNDDMNLSETFIGKMLSDDGKNQRILQWFEKLENHE